MIYAIQQFLKTLGLNLGPGVLPDLGLESTDCDRTTDLTSTDGLGSTKGGRASARTPPPPIPQSQQWLPK